MVILSYDISDDKKRTKFSKFIKKYGVRLQYSMYEIINSDRVLNNVCAEIENKFSKQFDQSDSVYIFKLSSSCETIKYGYAEHEDDTLIIL